MLIETIKNITISMDNNEAEQLFELLSKNDLSDYPEIRKLFDALTCFVY